MTSDLSLVLEIALVCHNDDGEVVFVFDTKDLLMECRDFVKTVAGRNAVDEKETLASAHVLLSHRSIKYPSTQHYVRSEDSFCI